MHRLGQTKPVHVYRLCTAPRTLPSHKASALTSTDFVMRLMPGPTEKANFSPLSLTHLHSSCSSVQPVAFTEQPATLRIGTSQSSHTTPQLYQQQELCSRCHSCHSAWRARQALTCSQMAQSNLLAHSPCAPTAAISPGICTSKIELTLIHACKERPNHAHAGANSPVDHFDMLNLISHTPHYPVTEQRDVDTTRQACPDGEKTAGIRPHDACTSWKVLDSKHASGRQSHRWGSTREGVPW